MSSDLHNGKGYAPLPQSISNTDTEDEERLTQPNDITYKVDNNDTTIAVSYRKALQNHAVNMSCSCWFWTNF